MTAAVPLSSHRRRTLAIASGVVGLHVLALWALQTGLLRRAVEVVVPVSVLSEVLTPPAPQPAPPQPKPPAPPPPKPVPKPAPAPAPKPLPAPAPAPTPAPAPAPAVTAPVANPTPGPAAPTAAPPAPAAAPAPARVDLPSSTADYLQNPKPAYPPLSRRLGEQGTVIVRVLIGADGQPQKAELRQSSGFDRLDQAALATVMKWRYVPGKRAGVPETMWFNVPIQFVLE